MDCTNKTLLTELKDAREKLERQIDLILIGKPLRFGMNREAQVAPILATLRGQLCEINELIAEMETA